MSQRNTHDRKQTSALVDGLFQRAEIPMAPKVEQRWEELEGIYNEIGSGLIETAENINSVIVEMQALGYGGDKELINAINGVRRDIDSFSTQLLAIKQQHADKSGPIEDGDDMALCLQVFNEYVGMNEQFRAIVFPTLLLITEKLGDAKVAANKLAVTETEVKPEVPSELAPRGETPGFTIMDELAFIPGNSTDVEPVAEDTNSDPVA